MFNLDTIKNNLNQWVSSRRDVYNFYSSFWSVTNGRGTLKFRLPFLRQARGVEDILLAVIISYLSFIPLHGGGVIL